MSTNNVPTPFLNHRPRNSPHGYESEKEQHYYVSRGSSPEPVNPYAPVPLKERFMDTLIGSIFGFKHTINDLPTSTFITCQRKWSYFFNVTLGLDKQQGSYDSDGNVRLSRIGHGIKENFLVPLEEEAALINKMLSDISSNESTSSTSCSAENQQEKGINIEETFPFYTTWSQFLDLVSSTSIDPQEGDAKNSTCTTFLILQGLHHTFNARTHTSTHTHLRVTTTTNMIFNYLPELDTFFRTLKEMSLDVEQLQLHAAGSSLNDDYEDHDIMNDNHELNRFYQNHSRRNTESTALPRTPKIAAGVSSSSSNTTTARCNKTVSAAAASCFRLSGSRRSRVYEDEGDDDYSRYSCHRI